MVDVDPDPQADPVVLEFVLAGSRDAARVFDLELQEQLPAGVQVALEVPAALFAVLPKGAFPGHKSDPRRLPAATPARR